MSGVNYDFTGKVVLVTGASSGIGKSTALRFAACGASVVVADIAEASGEQLAQEIRNAGVAAFFHRTNVSRMEDCQALLAAIVSRFGRLDCAFNNAGIIGQLSPTAGGSTDNWQAVVGVNLTGVFNCLACELEIMKDTGGSIVNTSSVLGLLGGINAAAYSASKHGVIGLTRTTALEYGRRHVRVNAICPGFVETPMTAIDSGFSEKATAAIIRRTALGRFGTPEEIAEAAIWLCSDAAAFVSGAVLSVDGGYTA